MVTDCHTQTTLLGRMRYSETVPKDVRLYYYKQIADGMTYLHQQHFIHGCLQAKFVYVAANDRVSKIPRYLLTMLSLASFFSTVFILNLLLFAASKCVSTN